MYIFSGICVPPDFWCDSTNDCGDLYDESECEGLPLCSFEEDEECDWGQEDNEDDIGE